ncbi:MAG: hypothetical protein J6B68_05870 [Lachnospiraceae bacterium]|jgi:hypothetical protein|nr:hypothetical protein [Lachnospiraceae bacterium]
MEDKVIKEEKRFEYTYSASQQKEVEEIRKKYLPKEIDKMEMLRKLDKDAEKPGMIAALTFGIVGAMLLGIGMCCTMLWKDYVFVLGIIVGIMGIAILSVAYPVYKKVTMKQRDKVAEQILKLSNELTI